MTPTNNLTTQSNHPVLSIRPILIGATIALLVISFFIFGVDAPHPEWGKFWRIKPLIITPLAGATGGAFYSYLQHLSAQGKLNKLLAILLSLIVYCIGLFLGVVLGLNGTMWD